MSAAAAEPGDDPRQGEHGDVDEHAPSVGQRRKRIRYDAGDDLDDGRGHSRRDRDAETARAADAMGVGVGVRAALLAVRVRCVQGSTAP